MKKQPVITFAEGNAEEISTPEVQNPVYIWWQIFDEIPKWVYTIEGEGYFNKDDKPLNDETTIKYLTDGEQVDINAKLDYYDMNDDIDYMDYDEP